MNFRYSSENLRSFLSRDTVRLFLALMVFFAIFSHWIGANGNSRLDLTRSVVENQSLRIDGYEYNTNDKALIDGHYYSDKAPLSSLLAVPGYATVDLFMPDDSIPEYYLVTGLSEAYRNFHRTFDFKTSISQYVATISVNGVFGALTSVILFKIFNTLGYLSRKKNLLIAFLAGIGTHIFPYSTTFYGGIVGTCFLLLSTYIWLDNREEMDRRNILLLSTSLGLGVSSSYLVAIPGTILFLTIFREDILKLKLSKGILYSLGGGLVGLLPLIIYNTAIFGHPFELTMFYNPTAITAEPAKNTVVNHAFYNLSPGLMASKALRLLFYPGHGLFLFTPVLLFGVYGLQLMFREEKVLGVYIGSAFLLSLVFISSLTYWGTTGAIYGARYLLPVSTLLFIPIVIAVRRLQRKGLLLFALISILSVYISLSSSQPWASQIIVFQDVKLISSIEPLYAYLISDYLPNSVHIGFQSPLMSYLTGFTENFNTVIGPYPDREKVLGEFLGHIVFYKNNFLWLFTAFAGALLLLRREVEDIFNERLTGILVALLFLTALGGLGSTSPIYYSDWHPQQSNESVTWGRENPEIYVLSEAEKEKTHLMELNLRSVQDTGLKIQLNNQKLIDEKVDSGQETYVREISLEPGLNRISIETDRRCSVLGKLNNNQDVRCVTVGIEEFNLDSTKDRKIISGAEVREKDGKYVFRQKASFFLTGAGEYSLEMDGVSTEGNSTLEVYEDGDKISEAYIESFDSKISTPYREVEGLTEITLRTNCSSDCGEVTIENLDFREPPEQSREKGYRVGRNWYVKLPSEQYRWSPGNSSVFLYNDRDSSVRKTLYVSGISFHRPQEVGYFWNGKPLDKRLVPETHYRIAYNKSGKLYLPKDYPVSEEKATGEKVRVENAYRFNITMAPGENVLELKPERECISMGEVNQNNDIRCASFGLKDIILRPQ